MPGTNSSASSRELVLNAAAGSLVIGLPITDNAGVASAVVVTGSGTNGVTLSAANSHSGGTTLNAGGLTLGNVGGLGSSNGVLAVAGGQLDLGEYAPSGALALDGGVISNGTLKASSFMANNPNSAGVSAVLAGASAFLTKNGAGTLSLTGQNTYGGVTTINAGTLNCLGSISGPVIIAGGTLAGNGAVGGAVTIQSGGTLAPGNNSIGTLTINNTLANAGNVFILLDKSGATLTNSAINGISTFSAGGTLSVSNIGAGIVTVGDSFKLVSATSYQGAFTGILPATPGAGLVWNTNGLATNGTLAVAMGTIQPQVTQVSLSGTNLVMSGSGGAAGYGYSVLSSTNLATPLAGWDVVGASNCDGLGGFIFTTNINSQAPQQFYVIRVP